LSSLYIVIFNFFFWDRDIPLAGEHFDDGKQIMLAIIILAIIFIGEANVGLDWDFESISSSSSIGGYWVDSSR
jgi:hypothetical protein